MNNEVNGFTLIFGKQQLPSNFHTSYSISALLRILTKLLQLHEYCD